jgi:hypothetical protein
MVALSVVVSSVVNQDTSLGHACNYARPTGGTGQLSLIRDKFPNPSTRARRRLLKPGRVDSDSLLWVIFQREHQ